MSDPTRRDWMRGVGAGALGLVLASCGDNLEASPATSAVLEPTHDAAMVWVWAQTAREAHAVISLGADVVRVVPIDIDADGFGVADVTGLEPATTYAILVTTSEGARLGPHRVVTAPRDDDPRPVRIAVSADLDPLPEFESGLIAEVAAAEPDLFVSIGDFPYTDNGPPAATVAEYRERHLALRTAPSVRPLFEGSALRCIYDDHEFRNDWDTMRAAMEADRFAAAMQVWDELFPVRGAAGDVRYRSFRWGANAECFLLDCRRFRSADGAPDGPDKTMLGAAQKAWFLAAIKASTAPFKLVFTSIPLDFGNGDDHWASFAHERDAIFAEVVGIPGVLFLSADQHWFAAHRHAHGIREIQMGPIARGLGTPAEPAPPGVLFRSVQYNVALLDITADALTVTGLAADGSHFYTETLTSAQLAPLA